MFTKIIYFLICLTKIIYQGGKKHMLSVECHIGHIPDKSHTYKNKLVHRIREIISRDVMTHGTP